MVSGCGARCGINFPAALEAFEDLDAADTLEVPGRAPDPAAPGGSCERL